MTMNSSKQKVTCPQQVINKNVSSTFWRSCSVKYVINRKELIWNSSRWIVICRYIRTFFYIFFILNMFLVDQPLFITINFFSVILETKFHSLFQLFIEKLNKKCRCCWWWWCCCICCCCCCCLFSIIINIFTYFLYLIVL